MHAPSFGTASKCVLDGAMDPNNPNDVNVAASAEDRAFIAASRTREPALAKAVLEQSALLRDLYTHISRYNGLAYGSELWRRLEMAGRSDG